MIQPCPLPEVGEALQPYIRSRPEVDEIRQALRTKLDLTGLNAVTGISLPSEEPTSHSSLHKAYWKALQAHRKAQSKYEALKAEVDQLTPADASQTDTEPILKESYLPLLRQREKQRKIAILDRAFTRISSVGGETVTESFDLVVRKEIGDLPNPPSSAAFPERELDSRGGPDLTQLKQAILSSKQKLDKHRKITLEYDPSVIPVPDPQTELQALQNTHNELTLWMEKQLAMISDVDPAAESDNASSSISPDPQANRPGDDIESLYEQYLEGRQKLLETIIHPSKYEAFALGLPSLSQRENDSKDAGARLASETTLPYLTRLMAMRQQEQYLIQQSAHTRRQVTAAEADTQAALGRLADESHLVPPSHTRRSYRGKDWSRAASTVAKETNDFALKRLAEGLECAGSANQSLSSIKGMPDSIGSLAG